MWYSWSPTVNTDGAALVDWFTQAMFLMHFFMLDTEFFLQPWVGKFHSSGKHLPKRRAKGSWSYLGNWMLKMKSPIMRASTEEILLHPACLVQASYVEATSIAQHAREQEGSPGVCNSSTCCLCVFRDFWGRKCGSLPKDLGWTISSLVHQWLPWVPLLGGKADSAAFR